MKLHRIPNRNPNQCKTEKKESKKVNKTCMCKKGVNVNRVFSSIQDQRSQIYKCHRKPYKKKKKGKGKNVQLQNVKSESKLVKGAVVEIIKRR